MSLASIGGMLAYPDHCNTDLASATTSFTFDALNDMAVFMVQLSAGGTIDNVHFNVTASSSPVLTLSVSIQTIDATTGKASGSAYGSSATPTFANPTTGDKSAAVAVTATAGSWVAVVIKCTAFTSGSCAIAYRTTTVIATGTPYRSADTGAGDALAQGSFMSVSLEYSGSVWNPLQMACCGTRSAVTVSTSNPTIRGNIFTQPFPCRARGIWATADPDSCKFSLRDAAGTILLSATPDKDMRGSNANALSSYLFDSGATVNLTAATQYIATIDGVDGTTSAISMLTSPSVGHFGQLPGGINCYGYNYSGSWSAANTTRYWMGILIDQIDDGAGGGGGMLVNPGMSGGLRG